MHPYTTALATVIAQLGPTIVPRRYRGRLLRGLDQLFEAYAPATAANVRLGIRSYLRFCALTAVRAFPGSPKTLQAFVTALAGSVGADSVRQRLTAVRQAHRAARLPDAGADIGVQLELRRIARCHPPRRRQVPPLPRHALASLLPAGDGNLRDLRDRALALAALDCLARRSEIVRLGVADIQELDDGAGLLTIRRAKAHGEAADQVLWSRRETMVALRAWLAAAGIASGPVFRAVRAGTPVDRPLHPAHVSRALRRMARAAGQDPCGVSSHALRVGAAQDLLAAGASLPQLMQAGGWRSEKAAMAYAARLPATRSVSARVYGTGAPPPRIAAQPHRCGAADDGAPPMDRRRPWRIWMPTCSQQDG